MFWRCYQNLFLVCALSKAFVILDSVIKFQDCRCFAFALWKKLITNQTLLSVILITFILTQFGEVQYFLYQIKIVRNHVVLVTFINFLKYYSFLFVSKHNLNTARVETISKFIYPSLGGKWMWVTLSWISS